MSKFKGDGWAYLAFGGETSLATSETERAKNKAPLSHFQHRKCVTSEQDRHAVYKVTSWHAVQPRADNLEENTLNLRTGLWIRCHAFLSRDQTVLFYFKSLLDSSSDLHLSTSAPACLMAQLHSNCKNSLTPLCCHVRCLGGEMINTGLLLMRLEGSLLGERWSEVCAPESTHLLQRKHWAEIEGRACKVKLWDRRMHLAVQWNSLWKSLFQYFNVVKKLFATNMCKKSLCRLINWRWKVYLSF